ncbi:MAG: arylesterase [Halofilum sp. (in: g-proteobacteria)]|nr:arylesterase [Halofilum sp. (in: g-proteobacteria)]
MNGTTGKTGRSRLLLVALLALLAGCGPERPLPPLAADAVILAFGDSLTRGTGADADASYPAVLERLTGRQVINAGEPGELSAQGRRRLPRVLDRVRPDLLILCHGGNDILRGRSETAAAANLRAMVEAAQARGIPVLLVGVPERSLVFRDTADLYFEVAEATGVPLEAEVLAEIIADPALKSDPIHPNAAGYRRLAEAIQRRLREAGAL